LTDDELKKRCAYWQKMLRLQDWCVDVRYVGTDEVPDHAAGACEVHQDGKLATVKILAREAYNETSQMMRAFGFDPEATLVHELLHIHFDKLLNSEADEHEAVMQEQAIELTAQALVKLSRGA
jgi:hypothetical protein